MAQNLELREELVRASTLLHGSAADRICEMLALIFQREWPHRLLVLAWIGASYSWSPETETSMHAEHEPVFASFRHILKDGVRTGEFASDADVELALGMIWGIYAQTWRNTLHDAATLPQTITSVKAKLRVMLAGLTAAR